MRAFIALTPDAATRAEILEIQQRCREAVERAAPRARVNWTREDAMHLTVRFFAELDPAIAESLRAHVAARLADTSHASVPLARIGGFPRVAAPRVIWIGPPDGWIESREGSRLAALARAVDAACDAVGLQPEDRRWSPHLTLARVKDLERPVGNGLAAMGPFPGAVLATDQITLYKTDLAPGGATHTAVWQVPLG